MKNLFYLLFFVSLFSCEMSVNNVAESSSGQYQNEIDSLLDLMTLREKIGQMNQYSTGTEITGPEGERNETRYDRFINGEVGSVLNVLGAEETYKLQKLVVEESRLGIPLIFAYDVIHGYRTIFPIPLAESCSWDLMAMEESARIAGTEAAAAGVQWTYAPMVDISRDARWGRVMEGAGEDPYLSSLIAAARIKGFQGDDLQNKNTIAACAKHLAGYGFAESGKDYNSVSVGRHILHNVISPPFRTAVDVKVATMMNAFNDIDGVPSTSNVYLQRDLLKGKWGFDGAVVSDWGSIGELIDHGVAENKKHAAKLAVTAGSDIDMESEAYINHLEELVEEGIIDESIIDDAVRRILALKYKVGLFEDPFKYIDSDLEKRTLGKKEFMDKAREVASKSIVLLKNENNLLPLQAERKIAVIGPLAKDKDAPLGNWRAQAISNSAVSLLEGIQSKLGQKASIQYAEGCKLSVGPNTFFDRLEIETSDRSGFNEAIALARTSDVVVMALGEPAYMSGEARSRADIGLPGLQLELLKEIFKVNKNVILVLMNGRPLTIPWEAENIPAIVEAWHLGSQAGHAIADVLSGDVNPSGKLTMSFPRHVGQLPIYYNHLNTGRPSSDMIFYQHHMDVDRTPLFPFGFGLSYTSFEYSNLVAVADDNEIKVSIDVKNVGEVEGEEIVQVYIRDLVSSISRPVLELKDFQKVLIAPNTTKNVDFILTKDDLSYYDRDGELFFESGDFEILVGSHSMDLTSAKISL